MFDRARLHVPPLCASYFATFPLFATLRPYTTVKRQLQSIDRQTLVGVLDYAFLSTALQTGRRVGELAGLRWRDVHVSDDGRLTLTLRRTKGGKPMRDTMPLAVSAALLQYLHQLCGAAFDDLPPDAWVWASCARNHSRGAALGVQSIADICTRRLGTSQVHRLRHTFARGMEDARAKVSDIQARLGHSSLATTGRLPRRPQASREHA